MHVSPTDESGDGDGGGPTAVEGEGTEGHRARRRLAVTPLAVNGGQSLADRGHVVGPTAGPAQFDPAGNPVRHQRAVGGPKRHRPSGKMIEGVVAGARPRRDGVQFVGLGATVSHGGGWR